MDKHKQSDVMAAFAKTKVSVEAGERSCGLTFDELLIACRNVGIDLRCGHCAGVFFTGSGLGEHDEGCFSHQEARNYAETIDNVREALGQKATHYLIVADDILELVEAVENDKDAKAVLKKLRER